MPKRSLSQTEEEPSLSSSATPEPDHTLKYTHLSTPTIPITSLIPDQETHHICLICGPAHPFPTSHYLSLHISEHHDPLLAVRRARGEKTYACLVEGCDKVCRDWRKRRAHCVDKHGFPREFDFWGVVSEGKGEGLSLLRNGDGQGRRKEEVCGNGEVDGGHDVVEEHDQGECEGENEDEVPGVALHGTAVNQGKDLALAGITDSMAALKFVPKSVSFGRRKGGGLAKS